MGSSKSKLAVGTPSSSAAFGRLRFDSPGKSPLLLRRLSEQRTQRRQQHLLSSPQSSQAAVRAKSSSSADGVATAGSIFRTKSTSHIDQRSLSQLDPLDKQLPQQRLVAVVGEPAVTLEKTPLLLSQKSTSSLDVTSSLLLPLPSPLLIVWIGPALSCALCYALYNIFIKRGSSHISPILGGVILQLVAAMFGTVLLLYLFLTTMARSKGDDSSAEMSESLLGWTYQGVLWAVLAGVAVGAAEMISFYVSSLGVQAMQSIPIIVGGSVLMGTILGWMWLGEQLSFVGWLGVIFISVGISLVGLDAPSDEQSMA